MMADHRHGIGCGDANGTMDGTANGTVKGTVDGTVKGTTASAVPTDARIAGMRVDRIPAEVSRRLTESSDGVDMDAEPRIAGSETVYSGPIFDIQNVIIDLPTTSGGADRIQRQLIHHAPCVVMLVHDVERDLYLLEREYRIGSHGFVPGLPAGLIDPGEDVEHAAMRELAEETGVVVEGPDDVRIERVEDCYSSEGMTDELAHIMIVRLRRFTMKPRHFDDSEHVESAWVTWRELMDSHVAASNSTIAILHERLRRERRR